MTIATFEGVIRGTRLAGGIYRTTYRGRMADIDAAVAGVLAERFPREAPLEVHDWAASDCLAAREWSERLFEQFPRGRLTASDLSFFLVEAALNPEEPFIFEEGGAPLQYVRSPFVIDLNARLSPIYPVNRWLLRRARRLVAEAAAAAARAEWRDLMDRRPFNYPPWRVERIPLLHPEAVRLSDGGAAFRLERHSVFTTPSTQVNAIISINILKYIYFSKERLLAGDPGRVRKPRGGGDLDRWPDYRGGHASGEPRHNLGKAGWFLPGIAAAEGRQRGI